MVAKTWKLMQWQRAYKNRKVKLFEHQKKTRKVLSCLGFDDFFLSECIPSLITFLNKISATSSGMAKIQGSRFTHTQQQASKLRTERRREGHVIFSLHWFDHLEDSVPLGLSSQLITQTTYCWTSEWISISARTDIKVVWTVVCHMPKFFWQSFTAADDRWDLWEHLFFPTWICSPHAED